MATLKRGEGFTRGDDAGLKRGESFNRAPMPESPLDTMEYTGNPEADSKKEAELTLEALQNKERKKALREKLRLTTDSEYWCALCFETREQKDAFLKAIGVYELGDKYIDGQAVAQRMGIALPETSMSYRPAAEMNKKLNKMVRD